MGHWRALAAGTAICSVAAAAILAAGTGGGGPGGTLLAAIGRSRPAALHASTITINGTRQGPVFDGLGAVSSGGTSRLLIDYPAAERSQILDYLFKPGYGASLQILKLEIGGDAEATDGAEPSFEHAKGHLDCNGGYEMWLAKQAVLRNPHIRLYALQWNAPGWVGHHAENPWTQTDISYLMSWLRCAKGDGLTIGYLGGWNEYRLVDGITPAMLQWFVNLRAALNRNGFASVKIVAMDHHPSSCCDVSSVLATHPAFAKAVAILGYHNICKYPTTGWVCSVPAAATASGKPIWATEIGALRPPGGTAAFARTIDNAYIQAGATAVLEYPLVSSMPAGMPEEDRGLVSASQPWSGNYEVTKAAWVIAQTTQVTQPGWLHVGGAAGSFGHSFGTYVAYMGSARKAWSLVAETSDAHAAQTVTVNITGGLPSRGPVHVWATSLNSAGAGMVREPDIKPVGGSFTTTLQPGYVYSFTTRPAADEGAGTAAASAPAPVPMPLPYSTTATTGEPFGPDASLEPWGLAAADGSFQYPSASSSYFVQTTVGRPDFWQPWYPVPLRFPYAVVGDYCMGDVLVAPIPPNNSVPSWCGPSPAANYAVSATVTFTGATQSAGVIARYYRPVTSPIQYFQGYQFTVSQAGAWQLSRYSLTATPVVLASGTYSSAPLGVGTQHTLSLTADGATLAASIDGTQVADVTDSTYQTGVAGISTGGWYPVRFDNLTVATPS